jgi:hypothetical protein
MNVKLILLRTGQTIIADVLEMVSPDTEKFIGYFFNNPCGISLDSINPEEDPDSKVKMSIRLIDWIPLSKDKKIPICPDYVISLMEPVDSLRDIFIKTHSK